MNNSNLPITPRFFRRKIFYLLIILLITNVSLFFFTPQIRSFLSKYSLGQKILELPKQTARFNPQNETKIVAKVGQESIYQKDLNEIPAVLPKSLTQDPKKEDKNVLLNQLVWQSIILQGAQAENLIKLDSEIYNSLNKNYLKRKQTAEELENTINDRAANLKGMVLTIWFNNPSPQFNLSLSERQQIALSKINQLHQSVKNKQITIQQAADQIKNDVSLNQLDKNYKINASFEFKAGKDNKITIFPDFDQQLRQLREGEVSDIYTAKKNTTDNKTIESGYLFGQIFKSAADNQALNFHDWYQEKQTIYQVTYY